MKQQNETEDHKLQTNQNSLIQSQSEEPKTVLITKQQPFQLQSNFKMLAYKNDIECLQNLQKFKHNLAKKIIKKSKNL
ncbi:unnamed protein product [Paramecium sonneborni]|uniref:Uncharacterized protein n=1 Tax=Paramecium sonneborni TaxID=65129 RepID=A0A8S1M6N7_9CILI|nr:unnamed protein product [Paramecium sonneborni]